MSHYPQITAIDELIGQRLRHFRESLYASKHITRKEFVEIINTKARVIGIDFETTLYKYRKYEEGINMPNELLLVLKLLGINLNWMYDYSSEINARLTLVK